MNESVILVAEDVPLNMMLIVSLLNKILPEANILEASNGKEAIDIFERIHVDLIFMDIQMPVMDGFEATREIRRYEARHGTKTPVPIIAVTAYTLQHEREKCILAGMDDFIAKPINMNIIRKSASRYLSTKQPMPDIVKNLPEKNTIRHFDLKGLVERTGVEEELLMQLAKKGAIGLTQQIQSLHEAISSENPDQIKKMAHAIKGVGLNLGFNKLAQMARYIESLAYDDPSELSRPYEEMAEEIIIIQQLIDNKT